MRTAQQRTIAILASIGLVVGASAQQKESAKAEPTTPRTAIDAATAPADRNVRAPIARLAPQATVDAVDVGGLRPPPERPNTDEFHDFRAEVGYVEEVPMGILANPNWLRTADGGRVWAIELIAPGAGAMRAKLHGRWGDDGLELRVYDPVSGTAFGPYTRPRLDENGDWWTTIIAGESIGLEFFAPPSDEPDFAPTMPTLESVVKEWPGTGGSTRGGLSCPHNDIMCSPSWLFAGRAVAQYSFIESGGSFVCTGALINRSPSDLSPLVLTADHCIDAQATANTVVCIWLYRTPSCNGAPPPNTNGFPRNDGALLLKTRDNSDVSLLGLYEIPQGDVWLGWDNGDWTLQSDATGIHHPGGSYQRISFGDVTAALWVTYGQNSAHVWRVNWDSGSTEGGSSGSPVLDSSARIRGQLKGGVCDRGDYGRFGVSFDTLQPYLLNMASPVYVQTGAGGDQLGTSGDPFNQVYEATFCVFEGDEVRIRAGMYNEAFTLWRPMTLNAENGVVRIGG